MDSTLTRREDAHERADPSRPTLQRWSTGMRAIVQSSGPALRTQRLCMGAVLLVCACVRLATIGNPPLDRTLWKEIDYVMLSDNYRVGAPFFYPTITWPAEGPRFTGMEFPLA